MTDIIPASWRRYLSDTVVGKAEQLYAKAEQERMAGKKIFPAQNHIFRALQLTPPEKVRVVIVGQDPYFREGQANGLAFSVNEGISLPPSLRNIYRELHSDLGLPVILPGMSGDLTGWAEQGILLLNTVLTVEEGQPNSHAKWGWQTVTKDILRVCSELPQPIVFMLWGRQAHSFAETVTINAAPSKRILRSSHPSPLGAGKASSTIPAFIQSKPFSRCNEELEKFGIEPVDWMGLVEKSRRWKEG